MAGTERVEPRLLYSDEELLVVDKPAGWASVPGGGVDDSLLCHLQHQSGEKLWVVHRLDREVSGVLLFARNAAAHRRLCGLFAARAVRKTYLALCLGVVEEERGVLEQPIRQCGSGRSAVDPARGKPSRTEFVVLRRLPHHTLVQLHPCTGRRHQLRVHLYASGHAIAGDPLYGDRAVQSAYPRLLLHALCLELPTPAGPPLRLTAPLPEEFVHELQRLSVLA